MTSIIRTFELLPEILKKCIEDEMAPEGLLADVNTFIPIYYDEASVNEPVIWMTQHPSTVERQADISQTMDVNTPFEFDCAVYETELEDSALESQNLTMRVIASINKNYLRVQNELYGSRFIKRIGLETYYPVGEVQVEGKSDRIPATGVILNVVHTVNWTLCCKQLENQGD